ncbi:hypothetical protein K457DRAFT_130600 [Linnemannia elongata AG-77]|uniref:Uncharacterized protein n=1 Tax=Linnemannia elongata AG-77 TaxID=1314771 RepID=A0A197JFX9_9FUNG|nr:hypothetical protein K457DRAFT_130600 [Linnemannia elongata AG-77]
MKFIVTAVHVLLALASTNLVIAVAIAAPFTKRASDSLQYTRSDTGAVSRIPNPPNDVCIQIQGGAIELANDSDETVFLYRNSSCGGGYVIVGVGATSSKNGGPTYGVRLGSTV